MGRFGRISLEDIVNCLLRYVPAFMTAAAIVAVVTLLPGKPDETDISAPGLSGRVPLERGSPTAAPKQEGSPPAPPNTVPAPSTGAPVARDQARTLDSGSQDFKPGPAFTPSGGSASSVEDDEGEPLQIVARAWATRTAGTPVASEGVPEGSLPVGSRLSQDDKRSFLRLEGDETVLVLNEDEEGTREARGGEPAVRACKVNDAGWEQGEGQSFDDAPAFDEEMCVDGTRDDEGSWTFDLMQIQDPTDDKGIALVPGEDAPFDFQVAFQPFAAAT